MSEQLELSANAKRTYTAKLWKAVMLHEEVLPGEPLCDTPDKAADYWRNGIEKDPRHIGEIESFYVLHLNTRKRITGHHLTANGTLDTLLVHPREVFRVAMIRNCAAVILMHNHPSGDPTPSRDDIEMTHEVQHAARVLSLVLHDHIIVGHGKWLSFRREGLLE